MPVQTSKTDQEGRLTLPSDFADCEVTIERVGSELRVRKAHPNAARQDTFKELMAGVTAENIHAEIEVGPAVP